MKKLSEALQIFLKYKDDPIPFKCICDILFVCNYPESEISLEDRAALNELGFVWEAEDEVWSKPV